MTIQDSMYKVVLAERNFERERVNTLQRDNTALIAEVAHLRKQLENTCKDLGKLRDFKNYVHARLDTMGVPMDPPGEHRDAGCRVGQRLKWIETTMGEAKQVLLEVLEVVTQD